MLNLRASHVHLHTPSDLISGGFNYDFKYSLDAKNAVDGLGVSSNVTSKGGVGGRAVTQVLCCLFSSILFRLFFTHLFVSTCSPASVDPSKGLKC